MTADSSTPTPERAAQLRSGVAQARDAIAAAARAAAREPADVEVVAVTKKFPASDIVALASAGITEVGENRHQEAAAKHAEVGSQPVTWHFIGQLQSNKARAVAAYADQIDTVDRLSLVTALERGAAAHERTIGCLVQVNLDPVAPTAPAAQGGRGGVEPASALAVADAIAASEHLELRGVMGMAPLGGDPAAAFAVLADVARNIQGKYPSATQISAGMSGDFAAAIAAGATHVRLGTAILGPRPSVG